MAQGDTNLGKNVPTGQKSEVHAQQNSATINTFLGLLSSITVDVTFHISSMRERKNNQLLSNIVMCCVGNA